jgi:uncharacterized membrane protein (UPF0127 family)
MKIAVTLLSLLFCSALVAKTVENNFGQVAIEVKSKVVQLEYADTFELRSQGLMYRKSLCAECGMLFYYQQVKQGSMWMRNTFIPLDVAFIRKDGVITDIKAMQAHDENITSSSEDVLYAWEMNLGWFQRNGISVGDSVHIKE